MKVRGLLILMIVMFAGFVVNGILRSLVSGRHNVVVTWDSPVVVQGAAYIRYDVYRATQPGGTYLKIATRVYGREYTDWLVHNGQTYYYAVKTVDALDRESEYSKEAKATIP